MKANIFDSNLTQLRASYSPISQLLREDEGMTSAREECILQQMANLEREIKIGSRRLRASGTVTETANLGEAKKFYLPLITEAYSDGIADQIVHVVPMDSKEAIVRLLTIDAGTAKNDIEIGDSLWGAGIKQSKRDDKYPYFKVVEEVAAGIDQTAAAGATEIVSVHKFIDVSTLVVKLVTTATGATFATLTGDADGDLTATTGAANITSATVNPTTGVISVTTAEKFIGVPYLTYDYRGEASMLAGDGNKITATRVPILLIAEWATVEQYNTFFAQYDLLKEDGADLNEELLKGGAATIRYARDMRVVNDLFDRAGQTVANWSKTKPAEYALASDYKIEFINRIKDAASKLSMYYESAFGNFVIVGNDGLNILRHIGAPRVEGSMKQQKGPYFYGTLDNEMKIYYVPNQTFADKVVVGFKGDAWIDLGYILGVYCGFVSTAVLMHANFKGEQGYGDCVAYRMIRPNFYCTFKIT